MIHQGFDPGRLVRGQSECFVPEDKVDHQFSNHSGNRVIRRNAGQVASHDMTDYVGGEPLHRFFIGGSRRPV